MDAFYASVEQRDRPELRGKPLIVGWTPEARGVVVSASYEARRYGIRSAMSAHRAVRLCPDLVIVPARMTRYKEIHLRLMALFREVTDCVEPLALDEAFLDVTTNHWGEPLAMKVAERLRRSIREELGLTASAGVGPNKFIAKLASDLRKPDGLVVIAPERVTSFVEKLPVEKLWGVGPATMHKLHRYQIRTTADVRACPPSLLEKLLGSYAPFLIRLAHGEDARPVSPHRAPKSRGSETTFQKDVTDLKTLNQTLDELAEDVAHSLERVKRRARTLTLKVRYHDFKTVTRSRTPDRPVGSASELSELARALLGATRAGCVPIRLIGVQVSSLVDIYDDQLPLFE